MHFVVRNIAYTPLVDGYLVTCYTNYPCHLYMRWTNTVPQKHVNSKIVRGAPIGTYIDQCFVVYTDLEQNEPGDTYTHTFTADNWLYCQTRWFYFWGTIDSVLSPSASCIFSHHSDIYPFMDFTPAQGSGGDSVDGYVNRVIANQTWDQIRNGPGNQVGVSSQSLRASLGTYNIQDRFDECHRSILTFPTTSLPPNCVIQSASIRLWCISKGVDPPWFPAVTFCRASPAVYNDLQPSDYGQCHDIPCTDAHSIENLTSDAYFTFLFFPYTLFVINKTAPTQLCLRELIYDASGNAPEWGPSLDCWAIFASGDNLTPAYRPRLRVHYLPG